MHRYAGQVAGLPGRILACAIGLIIAILSITGVYVWWKKRVLRVARRRAVKVALQLPMATGNTHAVE